MVLSSMPIGTLLVDSGMLLAFVAILKWSLTNMLEALEKQKLESQLTA